MAINHIHYDRSSLCGPRLLDMLSTNEQADLKLAYVRDEVLSMINNANPALIANFDEVVKRFGMLDWVANNAVTDAQRTEAQLFWNELDSCFAKRTGSVSSVQAARDQLQSKLRQ